MLNADGYYEIYNAGQLYWFAQKVNGGETTISAILMKDIEINSQVLDADGNLISDTSGLRQWTPIGYNNSDTDNLGFAGTFDGNGKTISGLYHYGDTARYAGLFSYSTGTIRDLTIADAYIHTTHSDGRAGAVAGRNDGSISNCHNSGFVSGYNQVGGIVGRNCGAIEKCSNSGSVTASDNSAGGIAGTVSDGAINNCYNIGSVKAESSVGGIAGWIQYTSSISNCFSAGTVEGSLEAGGVVGRILDNSTTNVTITNCYHNDTVCEYGPVGQNIGSYGSSTITKVEGKTTEQFASGEFTWLLNGESAEGVWKQTLDTDTYPKFTGKTVYYGYTFCGNTEMEYTNDETASETKPGHTFDDNGICEYCGAYESAVLNGDVYEIYNAGQLYWFAQQVNGGEKSINAILMNDIDLTNHIWTTICSTGLYNNVTTYDDRGYQGTFNGNGHVIKNFTVQGISGTNCTVGLFGTLSGTVKNLGVDNMTFDLNGATDVRAAGIAGQMLDGSLIEDCYVVNSTLAPNGYIVGGIAACNYAGTIKDCFTKNVTIQANARCGNLVSDTRGDISATDRPGTVTNCWTDADRVVGTQSVASYITDCHANAADSLTSGETAYALGDGWGQTIGTDSHPVFGGAVVYQIANNGCQGHGEYAYSNTNEAVVIPHEYINGICSACGGYEEAVQNADGYYEIGNLGQLMWFAQNVNTAHKALLTADITIDNSVIWTPIALTDGTANSSIFNGDGHTITFANTNEGSTFGLFGSYNYSIIENLYLAGSITCNTTDNVGALVNSAYRTTIRNVIFTCNITNTASTGNVGGLVGYFGGKHADGLYSLIENCAVYADITGGENVGGLVGQGWNGTQYWDITNAAYVGNVTGTNAGAIVGYQATDSNTSTFTNIYWCEDDGLGFYGKRDTENQVYTNTSAKTADQFASGEVAWLLSGSTDQGELVWYQNVGMDAYPKFEGCVVNFNTDSGYHNGNTVSVNISWTAMEFTYTAGGEWNPETHSYGEGTWEAVNGGGRITVKNVGSANVPVSFTFTGTMGEVTGQFDVEKAALATGRAVTTTLTVSGDPLKSGFVNEQIGTVTVSLGSSGWAVGDKVTFYSKSGTDYACAVSEETTVDNLVLRSETYFVDNVYRIGSSDSVDSFVENYVTVKGARLPAATRDGTGGVFTDSFIHSTLMAALTPTNDANYAVNFTIANNEYPFYCRYVGNNETFRKLSSTLGNKDVYYFLMWDFPAVN